MKMLHRYISILKKWPLLSCLTSLATMLAFISGFIVSSTRSFSLDTGTTFNPVDSLIHSLGEESLSLFAYNAAKDFLYDVILIFSSVIQLGVLSLASILVSMFQMGGRVGWFAAAPIESRDLIIKGYMVPFSVYWIAASCVLVLSFRIGWAVIKKTETRSRKMAVISELKDAVFILPIILLLLAASSVFYKAFTERFEADAVSEAFMSRETKILVDESGRWSMNVPADWVLDTKKDAHQSVTTSDAQITANTLPVYLDVKLITGPGMPLSSSELEEMSHDQSRIADISKGISEVTVGDATVSGHKAIYFKGNIPKPGEYDKNIERKIYFFETQGPSQNTFSFVSVGITGSPEWLQLLGPTIERSVSSFQLIEP